MGDQAGLATELGQHRRQRHLARADDVVDAAPRWGERWRDRLGDVVDVNQLHHRIEAQQRRRPRDP